MTDRKIIISGFLDGIEEAIRNKEADKALKAVDGFRNWIATLDRPVPAAAKHAARFDLYKCVSTDESRPFMHGVYHDSEAGLAIATDGKCMAQIRSDYNHEHAGEIILNDGRKQDGKFPNWRGATPDGKDMEEKEVDWAGIRSTLKAAKPYILAMRRCKIGKESREPSILIHGVRIAYEYAMLACDFASAYPDAKFYTPSNNDKRRPVVLLSGEWGEPDALFVIMPMEPLDDDDKPLCIEAHELIWKRPGIDYADLEHYIHHKDWDKRKRQGIQSEQDKKDEETIRMMADFLGLEEEVSE